MRTLALGLLLSIALLGPASAECFKFGCTDEDEFTSDDLEDVSCNTLYRARNVMYAEAGYCFKTSKAKKMFKKYDCEIDDMEDVELSSIEIANVAVIQEAEKDNGCK